MNEVATVERLEQCRPRRRGTLFGDMRSPRAVVFAVRGLLAFAALYVGPAIAEPAARPVTSSGPAQESIPALKREYLRCALVSSQQRLTQEAGAHCSAVSGELLQREFDGDLDRLWAWWRAARHAPRPDVDLAAQ